MRWIKSKLLMPAAAALLAIQGLVIWLDSTMETWFFDEAASFAINAALVWIIAQQRKLLKGT